MATYEQTQYAKHFVFTNSRNLFKKYNNKLYFCKTTNPNSLESWTTAKKDILELIKRFQIHINVPLTKSVIDEIYMHIHCETPNSQYLIKPPTMNVQAKEITATSIKYECSFCWSKYKQDGLPAANAKRIVHCHGNTISDFSNRIEDRRSHCDNPMIEHNTVFIHITDNTTKTE